MRTEFQKLRPSEFVVRTSLQLALCRDVRKFLDLSEVPMRKSYFPYAVIS